MDIIFCGKRNRIVRKNHDIKEESEFGKDDASEVRQLAFKAGFISLKDRVNSLNKRDISSKRTSAQNESDKQPLGQFATLQELFSARQNVLGSNTSSSLQQQQYKRPKIPVMKLNKDDWNVKCWEDRLSAHKRRQMNGNTGYHGFSTESTNTRSCKPKRQVEVFQGRIKDVAEKIEKVRDGAPQDETLYLLDLNKASGKVKKSHEWTDLLKSELENGIHNPRQLRNNILASYNTEQRLIKSPLGRPIRRIYPEVGNDEFE